MSGIEIVLGVVLGLVVNEATDLSPWLGRLFVRWSARLKYGDAELGVTRSEELQALIDTRPGKLLKLFTGAGFVSSALLFRARRLVRPQTAITDAPATALSELAGAAVLRYDDEPTTLIARYLFPTERYRGEWKRHWIALVKSVALILLYAVLIVWAVQLRIKPQYADDLTIWTCAVTPLILLWQVPRWYFERLSLTNKRLMLVHGVVRRRVETLPLLRVTDIRYVQSPLGRLLSYGTFENLGAGRRRPLRRLRDLPDPNSLYLRLVEEMYEPLAVEARLGMTGDDDAGEQSRPEPTSPEVGATPDPLTNEQVRELVGSIAALVEVLRSQAPPASRADDAKI